MAFLGNSQDEGLGDLQGYIQSILDNSNPSHSPLTNPWSYYTQAPQLGQLMQLLNGQRNRELGLASRQAGAVAQATGADLSSSLERARSPIYNAYANAFTDLPLKVSQAQLQANQGNIGNLLRLLQLKLSATQGRDTGFAGGLGGLLGNIGGLAASGGLGALGGMFSGGGSGGFAHGLSPQQGAL